MKLPGGEHAIVDLRKLSGYCLSPTHPEGRHKARRFREVLGLTEQDGGVLADWLRRIAVTVEAREATTDRFGRRFFIDAEMAHNGRVARVRSAWIIRAGEQVPRLTSCYVSR